MQCLIPLAFDEPAQYYFHRICIENSLIWWFLHICSKMWIENMLRREKLLPFCYSTMHQINFQGMLCQYGQAHSYLNVHPTQSFKCRDHKPLLRYYCSVNTQIRKIYNSFFLFNLFIFYNLHILSCLTIVEKRKNSPYSKLTIIQWSVIYLIILAYWVAYTLLTNQFRKIRVHSLMYSIFRLRFFEDPWLSGLLRVQ